MSDSRQTYDEQLPWLEAVDDEEGAGGVPARRMFAALLVVLLAVAVVAGTFFWIGRRNGGEGTGAPELIRAEAEPYKVKPTDPGGLDVAGESETAFETSAGQDTDAQIDLSKTPETAIAPPPNITSRHSHFFPKGITVRPYYHAASYRRIISHFTL